jgi:histidinol-phosphatase
MPEVGDNPFAGELSLAVEMADHCDAVTLPAFQSKRLRIDHKADNSEVTEADRGAERVAVELLRSHRPDHAVLGEEFGTDGPANSPWRWIIDPIDGTSGFARGIPIWATLIALEHADDGLAVAVVSAPALGRRWWATRGGGACTSSFTSDDSVACCVSDVDSLTEAQVSLAVNQGWHDLGAGRRLEEWALGARRSRNVGDFWQHCLVAEGAIDVAVDAVGLAVYDVAAPRLIVEEAGGMFTDHTGAPSHAGPTAVSSNGVLHREVLAVISG